MKTQTAVALSAMVFVAVASAAASQQLLQGAPPPQLFVPGMDDLMTILIQPRHERLYFAGAAGNWELAASDRATCGPRSTRSPGRCRPT